MANDPIANEERKNRKYTINVEDYDLQQIEKLSLEAFNQKCLDENIDDDIKQRKKETTHKLHMALKSLTKRQYDILILCGVYKYKQENVSQVLGISQQSVSKHYRASVKKMKKNLAK